MTDAQRKMRTAICYGGPLHGTKIVAPENLIQFVGSWPTGGEPRQIYELRKWMFPDGAMVCVWCLNGMDVDDGAMHNFLMANGRTEKPLDSKTIQG